MDGIVRKLQWVDQAMEKMVTDDLVDLLTNPKNVLRVGVLDALVQDIHDTLIDYQVCTANQTHSHGS